MRNPDGNRYALLLAAGTALLLVSAPARALTLLDSHTSPRNRERSLRRETRYIILHTTEGSSRGALPKLSRNGEAHYLIDEQGRGYRIVDRRRIAYHCGLSMWEGRTNLDRFSIGIEVAGYHDRTLNASQMTALKALLDKLKRIYRIPDERVLTHSMVAYGAPNRWHNREHRGRKRCGMQFARWETRRRLGLMRQPRYDPDVRAGRLINADPDLAVILYGSAREQDLVARRYADHTDNVIGPRRSAWDIARDRYDHPDTHYLFPDGTVRRGNEIKNWHAIPPGTRVATKPVAAEDVRSAMTSGWRVLGTHGNTPSCIAGAAWRQADTWYLYPDGRLLSGDRLAPDADRDMPAGTRILTGYAMGGPVTARQRAFDISGPRWNAADTFYLLPDGNVLTGTSINENRIPDGARILFRR